VKPIGTITMCFSHIDEDTRGILETIMDEAVNYSDFAERLAKRVLSEKVSPLLEYLAIFFLYNINNYNLIYELEKERKVPNLAEPLILTIWAMKGESASWEEMRTSLHYAISDAPNDWFATHLYLNWRIKIKFLYPEADVDIRPIDIITSNVNENKELECFKSYLYLIEADTYRMGRKTREELIVLKEALETARTFDDQVIETAIQTRIANRLKHTNLRAALDLLYSTKERCEYLGFRDANLIVLGELGHIMTLRGETNGGLEKYLKALSMREYEDVKFDVLKFISAFYYNQIGEGEKALEFMTTGFDIDYFKHRRLSYPIIQSAWALINLGRKDEAKKKLAVAHKMMLKSADNTMFVFYHMVEGILDKEENDLTAAVQCFEEVLKSHQEDPNLMIENICLLNLTEIEIALLDEESTMSKLDVSGPWMQRLFEHAKTNDLPGIEARALILQASLRQKQRRYDDMHKILKDVSNIANQYPSMRYLKNIINSTFPDLITK